jgi:hypothetical protein
MDGFMDIIEIPIDPNIIKVIRHGPKDFKGWKSQGDE